ncbi:Acyl-CoA dehydrogenase related to the alkylation response protein AidB [Mycobacterium numidiamassiliense]|jgi:alkylation response protein AidB-like acyl-CoA dehydrogenase|uniref:Acyl-CoA dehydrogenase related to the alkylation response protein AidB n=1 Tax=Mycobacterium numidiamassiliense TaxID=1841861 RepID=A0A2U3PF29_9MYCO|nr:acyl-CoA dehydrogenase family protein [Mycobacterium numidiamassiliense]SPM42374.1 Acyl-CoA dehydrogenase related to the alkylation response protein AidB [Mycobacterium numidiamassiliense]
MTAESTETVAEFRSRAKAWLAENMPPQEPDQAARLERDAEASWVRARELQKRLYDGGFAGICFPREYGGLGLGYEYKKAFDAESVGYEIPLLLNVPSFAICCATILDMGSEEQKRTHIRAALRGDEVLVQLLSEPSGGSDLAGVITRAERRDGRWIINGAKTWSTWAFAADYGLCLARTDWTVPKHEGLTMFLLPLRHPGITINRIQQVNGSVEFCEEFFDDVEVGDDAVVGEPGKGWEVASRQLYHERRSMGDGSEYTSGPGISEAEDVSVDLLSLVERTSQGDSERVRELIGRALVHRTVHAQLSEHVFHAVAAGKLPPTAGSIIRLSMAAVHDVETDTALAVAGPAAVVEDDAGQLDIGTRYLGRQIASIGGGTTEMARNVIGERVLNFPRENAADRGVPFNQVRRNKSS